MLTLPNIDPIAFSVFGWPIRWYGLLYLVGIWGAWFYGRCIIRYFTPINTKDLDDFIPWAVLGIIVGGRLGYVFFYDFIPSIRAPWTIFQTWRGGMAFHGGLIGVGLILVWYTRQRRLPLIRFMDLLACLTPIGLFFGRIGNFVNQEVYGRATTLSWGVIFPSVDTLARHPSQLYEAFLEGLVLFIVLRILLSRLAPYRGALVGTFLVGYALLRSLAECFRVPDNLYTVFSNVEVTQGQLLSLPMFVVGLWILIRSFRQT